jgi:hypothetical protein
MNTMIDLHSRIPYQVHAELGATLVAHREHLHASLGDQVQADLDATLVAEREYLHTHLANRVECDHLREFPLVTTGRASMASQDSARSSTSIHWLRPLHPPTGT